MNLKWKIFTGLTAALAVLVLLNFAIENDFIGSVVYALALLPAALFNKLGLPAIAENSTWLASPSNLGFILAIALYLVLFYLLADLIVRVMEGSISKKFLLILAVLIIAIIVIFQIKKQADRNSIPEECRNFMVEEKPHCLEYYQ